VVNPSLDAENAVCPPGGSPIRLQRVTILT